MSAAAVGPSEAEALQAEIDALEAEIADLVRQSVERDQSFPVLQDRVLALPYGDSEYRFHSTYSGFLTAHHRRQTMYWRNRALALAIDPCAGTPVPPPRTLPAGMRQRLAMGGRVPIIEAYASAFVLEPMAQGLADAELDAVLAALDPSAPPGGGSAGDWRAAAYRPYLEAILDEERAMRQAVEAHVPAGIEAAVLGRLAPLYEAFCISRGAKPVTIAFGDAQSSGTSGGTLDALERAGRRFERVLASPLVARMGLGLTGPDLDADADLTLMARLRQLVAPSGRLLLCVPTGADLVLYNLSRVYGPERLPLLLHGWSCLERIEEAGPAAAPDEPALSLFVLAPA
jgi:hypothetical protein